MYRSIQGVGLFFAFLAIGCGGAYAQGIIYADAYGTRIPLTAKSLNQFAAPRTPSKILMSGNLTWNITYQDVVANNNVGFDDPVVGAARQATAEAVLDYINQVLNISSSASPDVVFEVSQMDGGGPLASAGTLWFDAPNGFDNGFAFEHITTGTDPSPANSDIDCTIDFGYTWNSDHTVAPSGGQMDLFSVLLHEMTHGLGVLSLSDNLGRGLSSTNPDVYTQWDRLMQLGASTSCWNGSTTVLQVSTAAFTSDNLFFSGTNATASFGSRPPVYAPATYSNGSSLGHFKTGTVDSIMQHSIGAGVSRREYTAVDIAALRDIGYSSAAAPPQTSIQVSGGGSQIEGRQITFTATPAGALGYQWYRNGQPISGATGSTYVLESSTPGDSGSYYCEITTASSGVVTTDPVNVVIHAAADMPAGGSAGLSALALTLIGLATVLIVRGRRLATR